MRPTDFRLVIYIVGLFLVAEAFFALLFAGAGWVLGSQNTLAFALSGSLTAFIGGLMMVANRDDTENLTLRQAFLLTTLTWVIVSAFAALPLYLSNLDIDYTDAYFEAVSGLTTTGSTVLTGLDKLDPDLLLWRALLQWAGGVGIIVTAIAVLPILRIGGMQLFQTESSDRSERILPRASQVAGWISAVYLGLTILCAFAYGFAGMSPFDSIVHAMTTISTGGYATSDSSFGAFSDRAQWVSIVFMISGAIPYVLYLRAVRGNVRAFLEAEQLRVLLVLLLVATITLAAWLVGRHQMGAYDAIRHAAFNVVSVVTTTGYASTDYSAWGGFALSAFFVLTLLGGCTGSTAGGIKMFRLIVLYRIFREQLIHLFAPHTVVPLKYEGNRIPDDVPSAVIAFVFLYFLAAAVIALILTELGIDPLTAISSAATVIANVGPGLGEIVGPAGNFASLPDMAKWLLSFGMVLGRLELFTVLVLFVPRFWRF